MLVSGEDRVLNWRQCFLQERNRARQGSPEKRQGIDVQPQGDGEGIEEELTNENNKRLIHFANTGLASSGTGILACCIRSRSLTFGSNASRF